MGKRLSRIYTRSGDTGQTGLGTQGRVPKHDLRIQAMGDVDEVNSWVGHVRAALDAEHEQMPVLSQIQHDLFDIGGELAMPGFDLVAKTLVTDLETAIDHLNDALPPLDNFILPAGSEATSRIHIARSVARRAERQLWALHDQEQSTGTDDEQRVGLTSIQYINRLSDYFFVLARTVARADDGQEVLWQSRHQ